MVEETKVKMELDHDTQDNLDRSIVKETSHEEKLLIANAIAQPMAPKKLAKKIYKCVKRASKNKGCLRNGLKDVQKHIRKGETGIVVFAGDVNPIEIMCHLPVVCENKNIPYCYTPSRQDIGAALGVKRGSLMVLIKKHSDYKDLYEEIKSAMEVLSSPL
ncbi:H/ACA ribonucleoprotein complex subunit 2-like protein isoform X1 [Copidosoma floridanum]|uniref:H/ACA ribonucleoprotein complex subunit 2-like protein isoform X1 n=1 Tax=Copidosoma floridanum TaxID=29053 RepID=UPI0006C97AF3|nr:H/ACA ribonucleoprotein complex subunit 2-like protein isoform X1 [Copidosoma floridanum]XP_014208952.1 H/ACA ribonucleoprotein complex subunit 2-like protein isoform X1 [Copidosoma floridanum]XP_014208954.1 H/ACA ribonucleoprotein complex subunit 2-like protein isoform X1 [Copidosoma floridanum]